ncbi:MAG: glycosyltransferase [Cytophagales bacterium]|nr:glycosyltransferase [Cytophagales bacterium]
MPFFSVIIPTYNRANYIKRAIQSVLDQSFTDFELIVIDDASTDNTASLLKPYKDNSKVRIITNDINLERSASRNIGIDTACGTYICFLDSDDYYLTYHLKGLYDLIQVQGLAKALFHSNVIKNIGGVDRFTNISVDLDCPVESVIENHIPVITVAIHREILEEEKFPVDLYINEDVFLFAKIVAKYPVHDNNQATVVWFIHEGNTKEKVKDYITPQIVAAKKIFENSSLSLHISKDFKKRRFHELYTALVHRNVRNFVKAIYYLGMAWWYKPGVLSNQNAIADIVYHIPGGKFLKRLKKGF